MLNKWEGVVGTCALYLKEDVSQMKNSEQQIPTRVSFANASSFFMLTLSITGMNSCDRQ